MDTGSRAVAWAVERIGQGYIWGATGWVCSKARREQQAKQYPDQAEMILGVGAKWDGVICWDCATFVRGAARAGGVILCSGATSQWRETAWVSQGPITTLPRDQVVMLYRQSGGKMQHTGIYTGDGNCIHAKGTRYGVIMQPVEAYPWTHWALPAWQGNTQEEAVTMEDMVVVSADGSPVRMRREPSKHAEVLRKLAPGTKVIRESEADGWSRIVCGEDTGYMMSEFLAAAASGKKDEVRREEFDALEARVSALEAQA